LNLSKIRNLAMWNPFRRKPKLILYHYCIMQQIPTGLSYSHGSIERRPILESNSDYTDLVKHLADKLKIPKEEIVVVSLNRL
jgi:hypothetical protein